MKQKIGIIFGGKSGEHEVSIESARNIFEALDKTRFEAVMVGMDKEGTWRVADGERDLLIPAENRSADAEHGAAACGGLRVDPEAPAVLAVRRGGRVFLADRDSGEARHEIDVFFPIAHGSFGEDGRLQGLLSLLEVPFVGAGVLGSAVAMDKEVMKRLLRDAGLPNARFEVFRSHQRDRISFETVSQKLGLPLFVKPCNLGSSVGISKVSTREEFEAGVERAFQYDTKILVEETVAGREIECAVLGNDSPLASLPGEILLHDDFYSYQTKYLDPSGAGFQIPAILDEETSRRIQETAVAAFQVLECSGMARVDVFLKDDGSIYVNEINTLPGFTKISMYPALWKISGLPYARLLDRLVELAVEKHEKEKELERSFQS